MIDFRPLGYVVGLLVAVMGLAMLVPLSADMIERRGSPATFAICSLVTVLSGVSLMLACMRTDARSLNLRQAFLLTTLVWTVLPLFGAIPFMVGAPHVGLTDAYFEAMSGMTTTGTTVFTGLDNLPAGTNLWRGILQWLGGLGIVIVAMVFLPIMRVGGMQYFRSEGFDTMGKVLPRSADIAKGLFGIYVGLTLLIILTYLALGMNFLDASVHAFSTVSTGGFSTTDQSFGKFIGPAEYFSALFMVLASVPFIRLLQLAAGDPVPFWRDIQVRAYLRWLAYSIGAIVIYRHLTGSDPFLANLRESTFNVVSIFSGTGYSSVNIFAWGDFPLLVLILGGLIGGCTASTGCSIKIFRYLVLIEVIKAQIRRIQSPRSIVTPRLEGREIDDDIIGSVILLFILYAISISVLTVLLAFTGLAPMTAMTAAWTSIANIGPAFGPEVGSTGAVDAIPASAKWMMAI
ncbi:MAG TPA: TrkH family potassium uptake protein, partial [Paracoccaceae bacterium]|nr:TrkH family potassium uptake protein [Paracoccaceae bacterium]